MNARRVTREDYAARLVADGIEAVPTALSPAGLRLAEARDVRALPGFMDGDASVQDEAAQLCAFLFPDLPAGARVLDACAAPGGQTAHLAERFPQARILALDVDARRAGRIDENLARLGLSGNVLVDVADAADTAAWWDGIPFEAILLDAPCSASGVIRRHPDGKWLRKQGDIARLARQQRALLAALWPALAPGGTLVYATCSVLREENEQVVAGFLRDHPDARELPVPASWGVGCMHGRQLLPTDNGPDGFFLCRLERHG